MTTMLIEPRFVEPIESDGERPLHIARVEGVKVALCGYVGKVEPWQPYSEVQRRGVCIECVERWADLPDDQRAPI